jgi:predicted transcriptional regulator
MEESMAPERRPRGELKSRILKVLWDAAGPMTAKEIRARFEGEEHVPTLSTYLTVLDRLRKSGEVVRQPSAIGEYVFTPTPSESGDAVEQMLAALMKSTDRADVLLGFAGGLDRRDLEILRQALGSERAAE